MANKSKYRKEFAKQAQKLCEQFGAIDDDLAIFFGVVVRTIQTWKTRHPEFAAALKPGKDAADDRVERALYMRAVGYTFTETKLFQYQGEVVKEEVETHHPPDTRAAMYWLSNRRRGDWSFRPDGVPGDDGSTPDSVQVDVIDASEPEAD